MEGERGEGGGEGRGQRAKRGAETARVAAVSRGKQPSSLFLSPGRFQPYLERHAVPLDDARVDGDAHVSVLDLEVVLPEEKMSFFLCVSE